MPARAQAERLRALGFRILQHISLPCSAGTFYIREGFTFAKDEARTSWGINREIDLSAYGFTEVSFR